MDGGMLEIAREVGGGLAGVVIVALGLVVVILWRRNNELQDRMLEMALTMGRENKELLLTTTSAVATNTGAINALITGRGDGRP